MRCQSKVEQTQLCHACFFTGSTLATKGCRNREGKSTKTLFSFMLFGFVFKHRRETRPWSLCFMQCALRMELLPAVDRRIICKHFEKTSTSNKKHIPTSHNINKNTTSQLHTSLDKRYETVLDMSGARDCSKHTSAAGRVDCMDGCRPSVFLAPTTQYVQLSRRSFG